MQVRSRGQTAQDFQKSMGEREGELMSTCPNCGKHFREPEGERGEHGCPHCGMDPERWAMMCMDAEDIAEEMKFKIDEEAGDDDNDG